MILNEENMLELLDYTSNEKIRDYLIGALMIFRFVQNCDDMQEAKQFLESIIKAVNKFKEIENEKVPNVLN